MVEEGWGTGQRERRRHRKEWNIGWRKRNNAVTVQ